MHTASMPSEPDLTLTGGPATAPGLPPKPERKDPNNLTLKQRVRLMSWCEEHRDLCTTETDVNLATAATASLGFTVSTGNITGMRRELDITKTKPATPEALDLAALQAKVAEYGLQLEPLKDIKLHEVLTFLRDHLHNLDQRIKSLEASND